MSMQRKLEEARVHATAVERGRCIFCIEQVAKDLRADLEKKILVEAQRHTIQVKIQIFAMLSKLVRLKIISGVSPDDDDES